MRKYFLTAFVMAAMLVFATSGFALEKTAVQFDGDNGLDEWNAGATCSVLYYNTCTGWLWIWSGWSPGEYFGTCFTNCCGDDGQLTSSFVFVFSPYPTGYGFTSTIAVENVDENCCPTGQIASQVFFPAPSAWNNFGWGVNVGATFAITITISEAATLANPVEIATDHPAAGPIGPQACGACYPNPRTSNTYHYGLKGSPSCPGSGLSDGICDVELFNVAVLACPVSVEEASWGSIKNLYR